MSGASGLIFILYSLFFIDVLQDLFGVNLRLYLFGCEDFLDDAIFVNEVCCAQDADGFSAAGYFFAPATKLLQECCLGVGDKRELQSLSVGEFLLQGWFVLADAYYVVAGSCQLFFVCLEGTCLGCASAGVCLGIAVEYDFATLIVACLDFVSVLVYAKNLGYFVSYVHNWVVFVFIFVLFYVAKICIQSEMSNLLRS